VTIVGTSKSGGTISQQAVEHPWLAADAHGNKQANKKGIVQINMSYSAVKLNKLFMINQTRSFARNG
jgi:hypothetical protein